MFRAKFFVGKVLFNFLMRCTKCLLRSVEDDSFAHADLRANGLKFMHHFRVFCTLPYLKRMSKIKGYTYATLHPVLVGFDSLEWKQFQRSILDNQIRRGTVQLWSTQVCETSACIGSSLIVYGFHSVANWKCKILLYLVYPPIVKLNSLLGRPTCKEQKKTLMREMRCRKRNVGTHSIWMPGVGKGKDADLVLYQGWSGRNKRGVAEWDYDPSVRGQDS